MVVAAFLDSGKVGFDGFDLGGDRLRVEGFDGDRIGGDSSNFAVA